MVRYLWLSLLAVLCLSLFVSTSRAAPPPDPTTTQIALPIDQELAGSWASGTLLAKFVATPLGGAWSISATFRPENLLVIGPWSGSVSSKATGSIVLAPGTIGDLQALKLQVSGSKLSVLCRIFVDASGVVTVETTSLHILGSGGGGNGGGPCAGC